MAAQGIGWAAEFLIGRIPLTSLTQGSRIDIEEGELQVCYITTGLLQDEAGRKGKRIWSEGSWRGRKSHHPKPLLWWLQCLVHTKAKNPTGFHLLMVMTKQDTSLWVWEVGSSEFLAFFLFLCLNLSNGNHSALNLLHLGQHSLNTGQDLVLVCCWRDAYASHVTEKDGGRKPFRSRYNKNKHVDLIYMMNFTAFQWKLAWQFNCWIRNCTCQHSNLNPVFWAVREWMTERHLTRVQTLQQTWQLQIVWCFGGKHLLFLPFSRSIALWCLYTIWS